jgi:AcrR family transcriptional regulator
VGRTALTDKDREAFRLAVRDVATKRFARLGDAGVTMRGIAEDLGCSPMTPYRYVRDREEVFTMVRAAASEAFANAQEHAYASEADPIRRMRALGRAYVEFALEHPDQYRVMFQLELHGERDVAALSKLDRRCWGPMQRACAAAIESGELIGKPDELAHVCWGAIHGLVTLHLAGKLRFGRDLDSLVRPMMDLLLNGATAKRKTK